jgi:HEAT repeat protein
VSWPAPSPGAESRALLQQFQELDTEGRQSLLSQWIDAPDPAQVEALIAGAGDADETVRLLSLQTLEELAAPEALSVVISALDAPRATLREAAASALAGYRDSQHSPQLLAALQGASSVARRALLVSLRERRPDGALTPLLACLDDPDRDVRQEAIVALGHLGDARALPALRVRMHDADPNVQRAALGVLAQIDLEASVPGLVSALSGPHWQVRVEAARELARTRVEASRKAAAAPLTAALGDPAWQVRKQSILSLGQLLIAEAAPRLVQELSSPIAELRKCAHTRWECCGTQAREPRCRAWPATRTQRCDALPRTRCARSTRSRQVVRRRCRRAISLL